jgi:hypothetical protein
MYHQALPAAQIREAREPLLIRPGNLSRTGFGGGPIPWFRPRERRAFRYAKSEEVPTGVDRAGREACA